MQTAKGEAGRIGVSYDTAVVDIVVAEVAAGGPVRLDHLEGIAAARSNEIREGEVASGIRIDGYKTDETQLGTQGVHDYTARPGGGDNEPHIPTPEESDASGQKSILDQADNEQRLGENEPQADSNEGGAVNAAEEDAESIQGDASNNVPDFGFQTESNTGTNS